MFSVFIQHYNYTADEALQEYAKRFFALCAQMYKNQAAKSLETLSITNAAFSGGSHAENIVSQLKKQAEGNDALIEQAKTLREVRNI